MQSDHAAHSGKVMINDRVLGAIAPQTSLCVFMKTKWRKINFTFFPHILEKAVSFYEKNGTGKTNCYINYVYIHIETHAEVFPPDLCTELHLHL